jgi:hypothetical protein
MGSQWNSEDCAAKPAPFLPVVQLMDQYAHTILGRDVTFRVVTTLPEAADENTVLIWKDQRLSRVAIGQNSVF